MMQIKIFMTYPIRDMEKEVNEFLDLFIENANIDIKAVGTEDDMGIIVIYNLNDLKGL